MMQTQVRVIIEIKKLRSFEIVLEFHLFYSLYGGEKLFCTYLKNCLSFSNYIWLRERGYITLSDEVIKNVGHQMFERTTANILLIKRFF